MSVFYLVVVDTLHSNCNLQTASINVHVLQLIFTLQFFVCNVFDFCFSL